MEPEGFQEDPGYKAWRDKKDFTSTTYAVESGKGKYKDSVSSEQELIFVINDEDIGDQEACVGDTDHNPGSLDKTLEGGINPGVANLGKSSAKCIKRLLKQS